MSIASECDRCSRLFRPELGTIHIEAMSMDNGTDDGRCSSWGGIDFCPTCSKDVRHAIGAAIQDAPTDKASSHTEGHTA